MSVRRNSWEKGLFVPLVSEEIDGFRESVPLAREGPDHGCRNMQSELFSSQGRPRSRQDRKRGPMTYRQASPHPTSPQTVPCWDSCQSQEPVGQQYRILCCSVIIYTHGSWNSEPHTTPIAKGRASGSSDQSQSLCFHLTPRPYPGSPPLVTQVIICNPPCVTC